MRYYTSDSTTGSRRPVTRDHVVAEIGSMIDQLDRSGVVSCGTTFWEAVQDTQPAPAELPPYLPIAHKPLACLADAKDLLRYLYNHGLSYHCEDDATDCLDGLVRREDAEALNERMHEAYQFDWGVGQCPCGFVLDLDKDTDNGSANVDEGWDLFSVGTGGYMEIQSTDEAIHNNDHDAVEYVLKRSREGSHAHRIALRIHTHFASTQARPIV